MGKKWQPDGETKTKQKVGGRHTSWANGAQARETQNINKNFCSDILIVSQPPRSSSPDSAPFVCVCKPAVTLSQI